MIWVTLQIDANRKFTSVFALRPSFRANRLHLRCQNRNFASVFDVRPSFRAKGLHLRFQNQNFTPVLTFDLNFARKGSIRSLKIAILHRFFLHIRLTLQKRSVWKSQFYLFVTFDLHFTQQAAPSPKKIAPSPQRVPCDTRRKPHFTTCFCAGHARSPQQGCLSPYMFVCRRRRTSDSHFTTRLCVRHALSPERVTFRKPVFGCSAALRENLEELEK